MQHFDVMFLGYGSISSELVSALLEQDQSICVVTNTQYRKIPSLSLPKSKLVFYSWDSFQAVAISVPTIIVAWRGIPEASEGFDDLMTTLKSKLYNSERIIHLSSASVYQGGAQSFKEEEFDITTHELVNTKQCLEGFLANFADSLEANLTNLRIANVYGNNSDVGFINSSLKRIWSGQVITVFNEVDLIRDYLHLKDLVWAVTELQKLEFLPSSINISTSLGVSISKLVDIFQQNLKQPVEIERIHVEPQLVYRSILDCVRLGELIHWAPNSVEESLPQMIKELGI